MVVSYWDSSKTFEPIRIFIPFSELKNILQKVTNDENFVSLSDFVNSRTVYRLTPKLHEDFPGAIHQLSNGHLFDMSTNIFDRLPQVFYDEKPSGKEEYIQLLGRIDNKRVFKFIRRDYVNNVNNLNKFKILVPKSNGSGALGEVLSTPLIGPPLIGHTESFISIGEFETKCEAQAALKYIQSKFARTMLGVLKVTQDNPPETWRFVPLQDFTSSSDIDWSVSVREVDRQLYAKYGLTQEEIDFIETHVKEME